MAITTQTSGLVFNREEASEILTKAQQGSFVMQLGREVALPGSGIDYQVVTDGDASFVDEGASKPVVDPKLDKKTMVPHKIAVILAVSDELMEDRPALINHLTSRLPEQFAKGIDTEVCKAGKLANFGYLGDAEAVSVADMYEGLVTAEYNIGKEQYQLDNLVFSAKAKKQLRDAKDNTGRPIFDNWNLQDGKIASVALSYPITFNEHVYSQGEGEGAKEVLGLAGDFSRLLYGIRDGLTIDFSKQASIKTSSGATINCFQENMTAIRAEMRIGTLVQDIKAFNRLTA